jgi:hypothetical protein
MPYSGASPTAELILMITPSPRAARRGDVKRDQAIDGFGRLLDEAAPEPCACVVDEDADAIVVAQPRLDDGQLVEVRQVGGRHVDCDAGLAAQLRGQRIETCGIAGHQNEVRAAAGKTIGIGCADAGGGAGNEDYRFVHRKLG